MIPTHPHSTDANHTHDTHPLDKSVLGVAWRRSYRVGFRAALATGPWLPRQVHAATTTALDPLAIVVVTSTRSRTSSSTVFPAGRRAAASLATVGGVTISCDRPVASGSDDRFPGSHGVIALCGRDCSVGSGFLCDTLCCRLLGSLALCLRDQPCSLRSRSRTAGSLDLLDVPRVARLTVIPVAR